MLTREECEKALTRLYRPLFVSTRIQNAFYRVNGNEYSINDDSNLLEQLIKEHFDPQPYTFRELNKGMWIWDDKENRADKIFETFEADYGVPYIKFDGAFEEMLTIVVFEENRFFPLTKAM